MDGRPTLIESVRRALNLLDLVGESDRPVAAKTLARRTGVPLPTVYHLVRTLVHEGYLTRVDGGYLLGGRVAALSGRPARMARYHQILRGLCDELSAAAYLSVLDDGEITLVDVADGPSAPRVDLWVGFHDAAHAAALGKAVLSDVDGPTRREYLAGHDLPDLTPHTITDQRVLLRQLAMPAPYALDREEYTLGTACVAAAVPSDTFVAAVAVSVPVRQVGRVVDRPEPLRRAARLVAFAGAG